MALVTTKAEIQAPMITIVGMPHAGKSTLAAMFPKPVFIQAENAKTAFEEWPLDKQPDFLPRLPEPRKNGDNSISTLVAIKNQLRDLLTETHDFKTVIIDTVTTLNIMFEKEVIIFDKNETIKNIVQACGGYQAGYDEVSRMHAEVRIACEHLRRLKGMTIVFLAHSGIARIKNRPDAEPYATWTLEMHEKSRHVYINQIDAVVFLKIKDIVVGLETDKKSGSIKKFGKMVTSEERVLITSSDGLIGFVDAKCRYNFPKEIDVPFGENPLLQYIPFFYTNTTTTPQGE